MKTIIKSAFLILLTTTLVAFTGITKEKRNIKKSNITWLGEKVTGKHTGTISLKDGYFTTENNTITGGNFTIDMQSIIVTDLQGEYKEKLEGHLKSDDFFGIKNHPTATFTSKKVTKKGDNYTFNGEITIKGITQPLSFTLTSKNTTLSGKIIIDRTKFNIKYGSGSFFDNLGDKTIYDNFELEVSLTY